MKIEDSSKLPEVFASVAQQQAFAFVEDLGPGSAAPSQPDGEGLHASIVFSGPSSGRIRLLLPFKVCASLAENVLGLDEGEAESRLADVGDVVAELLNVLCGQFLTAVEGDKPVFNLSAPEISEAEPALWTALAAEKGCRAILVEESPALLCLEL